MSFERRASHEATEGDVLNSAEYRSAFFKSLLGQKMTEFEQAAYKRAMGDQRADAFASSTNAAAVLPTQTLNEVIKKARTMGGIMGACRAFQHSLKGCRTDWNTSSSGKLAHRRGSSRERKARNNKRNI